MDAQLIYWLGVGKTSIESVQQRRDEIQLALQSIPDKDSLPQWERFAHSAKIWLDPYSHYFRLRYPYAEIWPPHHPPKVVTVGGSIPEFFHAIIHVEFYLAEYRREWEPELSIRGKVVYSVRDWMLTQHGVQPRPHAFNLRTDEWFEAVYYAQQTHQKFITLVEANQKG